LISRIPPSQFYNGRACQSVATVVRLRWAIIFAGRNSESGVFAKIKFQVCAVLVMSSGCACGYSSAQLCRNSPKLIATTCLDVVFSRNVQNLAFRSLKTFFFDEPQENYAVLHVLFRGLQKRRLTLFFVVYVPFVRFIPVTWFSAKNARGLSLAPVAAPRAAFLVKIAHEAPTQSAFWYSGPLYSPL
jgi:hypothetical protein